MYLYIANAYYSQTIEGEGNALFLKLSEKIKFPEKSLCQKIFHKLP